MRRGITLGEVLRRTLAGAPLALAAIGASSCGPQFGPCGTHIVIMDAAPTSSDGGVDCSPCGFATECNAVNVNGTPKLACALPNSCIGGRRPASLLGAGQRQATGVGASFAAAARLEAASVLAFRVLARELTAHGAPGELIEWCHRSALEEVNHARLTSLLARRFGAQPERPSYSRIPEVRTLEEIAIENAVEGCARETFGAAIALVQSQRSRDPQVAEALSAIAADELRHAELGWSVADWSAPRLSRAARARVREARDRTAAALATEARPTSFEEQCVAGLSSAEGQAQLARRFAAALEQAA